ncbi:uncharacterized protein [Procambarus clarkii]|uniref:uncharacterized protein isoform X2 n=1 Tax=Procambarus clarkii TaxID=6728 RepID=UPI001E676509|nr:uncharacterized protein LOC123745033 isoform X2 [Procambarus clarkii]
MSYTQIFKHCDKMRVYGCSITLYLLLLLPLLLVTASNESGTLDSVHQSLSERQPQTVPYSTSLQEEPEVETDGTPEKPPLVDEELVMIDEKVLKRIRRDSQKKNGNGGSIIFHIQEKVHESTAGQLLLAGVLGGCVGILGGVLITLVLSCCCYFRCSCGGGLEFTQKNNTYRSADLIDGGV